MDQTLTTNRPRKIRVSLSRRVFLVLDYAICLLMGLICLMPVVHIMALSISGIDAVVSNRVLFWPVDFNWENYELVIGDAQFFRSYLVTF